MNILSGCIFLITTVWGTPHVTPASQQDTLSIVPIEAIHNPERGYHLESNFYVHNMTRPFPPYLTYPEGWFADFNKRYKSEGDKLSAMQLYLYLTDYVGKDIPEEAFKNMQQLFDSARENGYKFILRFAYDNTYGATKANFKDVFRHLDQLEPFIKKNIGLIDIWQIGFIGAWGEGHSSPMSNDYEGKTRLAKRILDIFEGRQTTIRLPEYKNLLKNGEEYKRRMGYNNDYFTASEHPKAPGNDFFMGSPDYEQVMKESPYVKVIGEIPYAEATEWGLHTLISVPHSLKALRDHHYSLFDITQNTDLNIQNWKETPVTPALMDSIGILYDESYFKEGDVPVARSAYDFIRDHLGYRLYVEKPLTKIQRNGNKLNYDIRIKNTGFSAIHNPRPVYLVLMDENNKILSKEKLNVSPRDWQPYDVSKKEITPLIHRISGQAAVPSKGKIKVGLWLPDPEADLKYLEKFAIQFANEGMEVRGDGEYRVNVVAEL